MWPALSRTAVFAELESFVFLFRCVFCVLTLFKPNSSKKGDREVWCRGPALKLVEVEPQAKKPSRPSHDRRYCDPCHKKMKQLAFRATRLAQCPDNCDGCKMAWK